MTNTPRLVLGLALTLVLGLLPRGGDVEAGNRLSQCGGTGQRHCCLFEFPVLDFNKGACDGGLRTIFLGPGLGQGPAACSLGTCTTVSFPAACGDQGERGCTIFEHIPSCKSGLVEAPVPGTCTALDADHYPVTCGDRLEPACALATRLALASVGINISACKPGRAEAFGTCYLKDADGYPEACGANGERPCELNVRTALGVASCKSGLVEHPHELTTIQGHRCGAAPKAWPVDEAPQGGPRTVLYIHGMNQHLGTLGDADQHALVHRLRFELPNVTHLYGVDYNNGCKKANCKQFVTLRALAKNAAGTPVVTSHPVGHVRFNALNFDIITVARAIADGILALPTEADITLVGHSLGGIVARQLVYRHYDELHHAGKRIAEVVTLGSPHRGGGISIPEMPVGQTLQTAHSCGPTGNATLCALQRWQDWKVPRENGIVPYFGDRWTIDDTSYPQVRWIAAAANGTPFRFDDLFGSALPQPIVDFIDGLVDNHDSDGVVAVSSALGLALDACYPFTRISGAAGSDPAVEAVTRTYDGVDYASAQCQHPGAAVDPRYAARDELNGVGHSLQDDPDVQDFVLSSLSLPPSPDITVSPLHLAYGSVVIGNRGNQTVTVRNDGTSALALGTVTLVGLTPDQFVVVPASNLCTGRTLAAGQSCTVLVRFKPKTPGLKSAKLRIPSNDPDEAPVKVMLSGTATGAAARPEITVTPPSLPFGAVLVGAKRIQTVTVKNDGTGSLMLGATGLSSATSEISLPAGQNLCAGVTLAPGQSCTVRVKIKATSSGFKTATLSIPSNDADENVVSVSVAATAL